MLTPAEFQALQHLDSCMVANAIETCHVRPLNEGFSDGSVRCLFPELPPMVGYAATLKIRGSTPPMTGGVYSDRTDWWDYLLSLPSPCVLVVQDLATYEGLGSLLGAVHQNILKALGCIGVVTNGSVRDLPCAQELGLQMFSGSVSVSHSYIHIVEFGTPVEVAGLKINSGDLIHGDQHGFQTIPLDRAGEIPKIAKDLETKEASIIKLCQSAEFSLEKLRVIVAS
jgi:regulator of RNase E activity RraA